MGGCIGSGSSFSPDYDDLIGHDCRNRTLGASAIGGMLIGMIFQIFIVPVLFVVFQWLQEKFKPIEWENVDDTEVEPEIEQYTRK